MKPIRTWISFIHAHTVCLRIYCMFNAVLQYSWRLLRSKEFLCLDCLTLTIFSRRRVTAGTWGLPAHSASNSSVTQRLRGCALPGTTCLHGVSTASKFCTSIWAPALTYQPINAAHVDSIEEYMSISPLRQKFSCFSLLNVLTHLPTIVYINNNNNDI